MAISLSHLLEMLPFHTHRVEKIVCYHCGEKMRESKALYIKFNGQQRAVCCHGCLSILHAIERNKMVDEYLQAKSAQLEVL
ncbi:heavy metal translocating P-type ATPase metal-binding domain-containing protein [Undibacterium sp. Ji67W]|uniref:heavy metal translocating P-type ATPase metal-binding domain-containing protein n=1 Tax=Undibacterium sp. Ji67W TaxID=3413042 RepID=UPI003BF0034E